MKRTLSILLSMSLLLSSCMIFMASAEGFYTYMNYYNRLDNEASIEWLEDAHQNAPAEVSKFYKNNEKVYIPTPALNEYPTQTAFVYRTANSYGGQCAGRLNTSIMVFTDKVLTSTKEAYDYLSDLSLIDAIDSVTGSITLVMPADKKAGFGEQDLANYYTLFDSIYNMKTTTTLEDGTKATNADAEYFGAYGKVYMIGIDGGATFVNNYILPGRYDCIGRVAGLMLIGGGIADGVVASNYVPVYLLNATDDIVKAYCAANGTDRYAVKDGKEYYTSEDKPLAKVISAKNTGKDLIPYVQDAFDMFTDAQRTSNISTFGGFSVSIADYQDAVASPAVNRYSLVKRNAIINGRTKDGNCKVEFVKNDDLFADYKTMYDQYLQNWYEIMPADVADGTAPEHSVPLILGLHGTGDDPLMYADEIGLLEVAGSEHVALLVPFEEELVISHQDGIVKMGVPFYEGRLVEVFPKFLEYILAKYPALDPSRVYATGYSLGGGSTYRAIYGGMEKIAAAVPMAGMHDDMLYHATAEQTAKLNAIDMPTLVLTSTYDLGFSRGDVNRLTDNTLWTIDLFCSANDIPVMDRDFEKWPIIGMPTDDMTIDVLQGEWRTFLWHRYNAEGIPMVGISCTENLSHSLYSCYAEIAYNFMKHFSRDLTTGASIYTEIVK